VRGEGKVKVWLAQAFGDGRMESSSRTCCHCFGGAVVAWPPTAGWISKIVSLSVVVAGLALHSDGLVMYVDGHVSRLFESMQRVFHLQ
jgi:hypothetical protein